MEANEGRRKDVLTSEERAEIQKLRREVFESAGERRCSFGPARGQPGCFRPRFLAPMQGGMDSNDWTLSDHRAWNQRTRTARREPSVRLR